MNRYRVEFRGHVYEVKASNVGVAVRRALQSTTLPVRAGFTITVQRLV